jgi:hypothetical protein
VRDPRHDSGRYYHCDCKDEDGEADHDDRFYHCDCIENPPYSLDLTEEEDE